MVTVLNAWSAETSWKICEGVRGVPFYIACQALREACCSYRRTSRTLPASGDGTPGQHEMRRLRGKCGRERREGRVKGA